MANYTAADVKKLRETTGSGMLDCKKALEEAGGDFEKAVEALRIKGAKDVGKRAERNALEGLVAVSGNTIVEILSLIHISEPTRLHKVSRMPSSA